MNVTQFEQKIGAKVFIFEGYSNMYRNHLSCHTHFHPSIISTALSAKGCGEAGANSGERRGAAWTGHWSVTELTEMNNHSNLCWVTARYISKQCTAHTSQTT